MNLTSYSIIPTLIPDIGSIPSVDHRDTLAIAMSAQYYFISIFSHRNLFAFAFHCWEWFLHFI